MVNHEIQWFKESQALIANERLNFNFDNVSGEVTLKIKSASIDDAGYYTCQIKNDFGYCQCEAPLFIDGEYRVINIENMKSIDSFNDVSTDLKFCILVHVR